MFSVSHKGSAFSNAQRKIKKQQDIHIFDQLARYGQEGVNALASATPVRTGLTAASWYYEVEKTRTSWMLVWKNSHLEDGRPIAILLQYGHATRTGGYVRGRDYINPAIQPIFDRIKADGLKAVKSA